ncbi:hypothetical protein KSU66_20410 [Sporosarcina sp. G11-34]|nr:hypothetical protein [Sporosarcina sp. G11-34]
MIYLETMRLQLRDWKETELDPFRRLNADEKVMTYFPGILSSEETTAFYKSIISEIKECGFGLCAVEEKQIRSLSGS